MRSVLVVVVAVAACGGTTTATVEPVANQAAVTVPYRAPTLPAAYEDLTATPTTIVDLDEDGAPEQIVVTAQGSQHEVMIDGTPFTCSERDLSTFNSIKIIDINPELPGVELVMEYDGGDRDVEMCYVAKVAGKLRVLDTGLSTIEDRHVLFDGGCLRDPMAWDRTADGFKERPDLAPAALEDCGMDGE